MHIMQTKNLIEFKATAVGLCIFAFTFCAALVLPAYSQAATAPLPQSQSTDNKLDQAKIASINELNRYLLNMDTADVNSFLKLVKIDERIKNNYVENVSDDKLINAAIKGMVNSLEDPYSVYMDPRMYSELMMETKGSFGGVGLILGVKENTLTVVAPIEGTPGAAAGILSGDKILQINGRDTKELALDEAVNMIRGTEGSQVILQIGRDGEAVKEYNLTRAVIPLKTVNGKMLNDGIGYIRIAMFSEHTGDDFAEKLQELEEQDMKAIILDLRNNPGGLLDQSIKVANKLVPEGPIVSVAGRNGLKQTYFSDLQTIRYPLVVLVNGGSASASEIVAGAIQDTHAGILLGTKTFGKGLVQNVMPLSEDTALKLTIAQYFTPQGRYINKIGIEPDVNVELTESDTQDVQLSKAMEYIKNNLIQ